MAGYDDPDFAFGQGGGQAVPLEASFVVERSVGYMVHIQDSARVEILTEGPQRAQARRTRRDNRVQDIDEERRDTADRALVGRCGHPSLSESVKIPSFRRPDSAAQHEKADSFAQLAESAGPDEDTPAFCVVAASLSS